MKRIIFTLCSFILFTFLTPCFSAEITPTLLQVGEATMTVNGKQSRVFAITQADGTFGLRGIKGQLFDVIVQNKTKVPLVLHWHGVIDPNDQDGVPYVTQLPIQPGAQYHYQFKLKQAGTFWFHSHYKLQEQKLMAAPLIIYDPNEPKEKEAIMFVQDFVFADPRQIYASLRSNLQKNDKNPTMNNSMNMSMLSMQHEGMSDMSGMSMDISDVKFDAYLTNHRTLQNPDIINVTPGQTLRLRIINASASSNYYVDLGKLKGTLIAVDGEDIKPITGSQFQMAIGNRLDIRVQIPLGEGAYPILALPEGTRQQTGLILATSRAVIPKLSEKTTKMNPTLNYAQEFKLTPLKPLASKSNQQSLVFNLNGDMQTYNWTINGEAWPYVTPYKVKPGQRVELVFNNKSSMAHPMHFHGHVFQITEIDGKKIQGRLGDTIDVMPHSTMKVVLDTDNPGIWMMHCHVLYHQMGGMMTTINYDGYPNKFTTLQRLEGEKLYGISSLK